MVGCGDSNALDAFRVRSIGAPASAGHIVALPFLVPSSNFSKSARTRAADRQTHRPRGGGTTGVVALADHRGDEETTSDERDRRGRASATNPAHAPTRARMHTSPSPYTIVRATCCLPFPLGAIELSAGSRASARARAAATEDEHRDRRLGHRRH
jgi:hypothetical protein